MFMQIDNSVRHKNIKAFRVPVSSYWQMVSSWLASFVADASTGLSSAWSVLGKKIALGFFIGISMPVIAHAGVDLVINTNDTPDPLPAGGVVTYNLTISNNGNADATGVTSTHTVPANTIYLGFAGTGVTCAGMAVNDPGPGTITCTHPNLASIAAPVPGVSSFAIQLGTTVQGVVVFGAQVNSAEADDNAANNVDNEQTTVNNGADFSISKTPATGTAAAGSTFSWTLTVSNAGPNAATHLRVQDPVPTGFSVTNLPVGCSNNAGTIICDIAGPVTAGGSQTIGAVTGVISAAGGSTVTNSAAVGLSPSATASDAADPDTGNNTAISNISISAGSDLKITKSRSVAGNLLVGTSFNFVLSPSYTGDSPSSIVVTDSVPSNYTVGAVPSPQNGWTCSVTGQVVTCTRPSGGVAGLNQSLGNITIPVTVSSAGSNVSNSASITSASPNDPTPGNNTATDGGVNLVNPTVDLGVSKTGPSPALVVAGVPFSFSIRASNAGTTGFFGDIVLTDNLPAGLTVTGYTLNGWTCSPLTPVIGPAEITCQRTYTAGTPLAPGDTTPAVVLTAQVATDGAFSNSAVVTTPNCNLGAGNCGDGDTSTYNVTSSIGTNSADIRVLKSVDLPTVSAGDVLTYTLEVVNAGPVTSNSVVLNDTLQTLINNTVGPTGAGYVGETISAGLATGASCSSTASGSIGRQLTCSFATIPVCTQGVNCPKVTVQVRPGGNGGTRTNTANVISNGTADPNHSNETASVNSNVDPRADVTVTKNATPASVAAGQDLTYVITAKNNNNGLSSADNVTITDTLPLDVTFVSATPSSGSCSVMPVANAITTAGSRTITCNLGTVNNGAQRTVTVKVRPTTATRGTTITNDVSVSTTTTETDTGNNTASVNAVVTVPVLDLVLNKTDSVDPLAVGDDTVYTITVTNSGPSAAENVVVTDTLPATGLSFKSATPSVGSCPTQPAVGAVGGTVVCNLGNFPAGTTRTVAVTMTGVVKGVITNNASVTSTETGLGFENAANNSVNETTTVRSKADMQVVSKIASASPVNLRDNFNFIVRVRNNVGAGLAEADGVIVADTLPGGMELTGTPTVTLVSGTVTSNTCTGVAGGTSFTCSLGTVSSGGEVDVTVPVQLVGVTSNPQVFTNRATVTTTSLDINGGSDPNAGNNFNSGNVTVNSSSIAGRVFRDFNNDGAINGADNGIAGITMTLSGTSFDGASISRTVTTDASGNYVFPLLPQGVYKVTEGTVTDINLVDGKETAGSAGGNAAAVNDEISAINLPANTAVTGYLFAEKPVPRIGIAKSAGAVVNNGDGTYNVQFSLVVTNAGATPLTNVQVTDSIDVGGPLSLGTYTPNPVPAAGQYTIVGAPTIGSQVNGASLTPAAGGVFTGSGAGNALLVAGSSVLPNFTAGSRSSATVLFTVRFFPTTPGPFENNAVANGTSPDGDSTTDNSVNGANPDPDNDGNPNNNTSPTQINLSGQVIAVAKALGAVVQTGPKRFKIDYNIIVANPSATVTATNVQVTDNLVATFPTAQTRAITAPPAVSACTGTVLNVASPVFNGIGKNNLLAGNQNLQAHEQCTIKFTTEIDFGSNALPNSVQNNTAVATTAQSPGGTVIATDDSNNGNSFDPNGNGNGNEPGENVPTPVDFTATALSSISGMVWRDHNHDRFGNDGPAASVAGFIVEVLNASGQVIGSTVTDNNGKYRVANLLPYDGTAATVYSVRFRDPDNGRIFGLPESQDPNPAHQGQIVNGMITELKLEKNVETVEENLPLDPSGVVYDSVTRLPVSGATVTLLFGAAPVPATCIVSSQNAQVTGASGAYQFLLVNPTPPGCPGSGIYTLQVKQPSGYLPPVSTIIPAPGGTYTPGAAPGVDVIQVQDGPPTGAQPTTYYFNFNLSLPGSRNVVNNHIPLDPVRANSFIVSKTGNKSIVELGDTVLYTVQAHLTNGVALPSAQLVDNLPAGFKYMPGTAKIAKGSAAAVPLADPAGSPGPQLTFQIGAFNSLTPVTVTYRVRVGVGAMQGDGVNRVQGRSSFVSSNVARFKVKVTGGVFTDQACVAGKVFVDCNGNHIQDAEEVGVPGVRIYMEDGTYFISDVEGKYSYCGVTPRTHVLKVDRLTLPRGSRLTDTSNRNMGDANSIFLDVKNGELIRGDFAEGSCSNTVLEQVKARRSQGEVRAPETERRGAPALKFEGKSPNYPQQGTDSANQVLVKPRGGGGGASIAESVNNQPVNELPTSSGNTRGKNLRDQKGEANAR